MKQYIITLVLAIVSFTAFAETPDKPVESHFAWGASTGANVDLTAHDMSAIDLDFIVGYRKSWIKFAGAGVGAQMMISNGSRAFPIYGQFRTNFNQRRSLVFWDIKAGIALNYIDGEDNHSNFYGSTGIGFNLVKGARYSAHMLLAYTFQPLPNYDLHAATLTIGVTFH